MTRDSTIELFFNADSEDGTEGRTDALLKEKEKEQEALFLYRQGVREEKRGNMYSGVEASTT